ncbi:MAG TPA: YraN family protein [bacterium]|nr:YraN family protein [bacterium]
MTELIGRAFGDYGERAAARFIRRNGGRVVARNWRCKRGEVDLIVIEGDTLAFVEVKTRESADLVRPVEYVNRTKRRKLEVLAEEFCRLRRIEPEAVRFDVVEVIGRKHPQINWMRAVWIVGE